MFRFFCERSSPRSTSPWQEHISPRLFWNKSSACSWWATLSTTCPCVAFGRFWRLFFVRTVAIELSFGLNYTFFRFAVAPAFLVLTGRCSKLWAAWLCLFVGQTIALSVSPEMGFAFAVAGTAFAAIRLLMEGNAWVVPVATPLLATLLFLMAAGGGYLRMLKLFSHGVFNLIVEPLPHILIFLFALVWLVPVVLASFFRDRRPEAPTLGALYVFALVSPPVAFGRADPGHVLFNGFALFFLSMVGVSTWKLRLQILWITCVSFVFLWAAYIDTRPFELDFRGVIHYDVLHYGSDAIKSAAFKLTKAISPPAAEHYFSVAYDADQPFDIKKLQSVVGSSKVATPELGTHEDRRVSEAIGAVHPVILLFPHCCARCRLRRTQDRRNKQLYLGADFQSCVQNQ